MLGINQTKGDGGKPSLNLGENAMKIEQSRIIDIDFDKEKKRLKKILSGTQLARHIKLVELAEHWELEKFAEMYKQLPYDEEDEFPEQEIVGDYASYIFPKRSYSTFTSVVHIGQTSIRRIG